MRKTEHPKTMPKGYKWRTIGAARHADYQVHYWRNNGPTKISHCATLTGARKESEALIRECSATYCEIYRYAENGTSIRPFIQAEYAV